MKPWVESQQAPSPGVGAIDWQPPLDRLEEECRAALRRGKGDRWVLAEVGCWLDLIDAEMAAARHRADLSAVGRLGSWRDRLEAIEAQLRGVHSTGTDPSAAACAS